MKKINILLTVLLLGFLGSCSEDAIDDLSGKYDMDRYKFTSVEHRPTVKLKKGIKALNMALNEGTDSFVVSLGCSEWILKTGTYKYTEEVTKDGEYSAILINDKDTTQVASGSLDVAITGDVYFINGLLTDVNGERFKVDYKGALTFEIGIDDPEASGYTFSYTTAQIYASYDWFGNPQGDPLPGVLKYTISISDPDGNEAAKLAAVNADNIDATGLAGTYTVASSTEPWYMDPGMGISAYWVANPSYVVLNGTKEFLAGGTVTITAVDGIEGDKLYTFTGTGLSTTLDTDATTWQPTPGTATEFSIKYASLLVESGYELRDQTITSEVLGQEMKYSIYLPQSYDNTKEYPVLYLLHGMGGNNNDWLSSGKLNTSLTSEVSNGNCPEMIVVCPDGLNTFYCDGYQDGLQYMTYFFDEFLPFIESTYKVKADRSTRAIAGLSMGGYGSLYYGMLHPEMFSYVYACSPAAYVEGTPNLFELIWSVPADNAPGFTIETGTEDAVVGEWPSYLYGTILQAGIGCDYIAREGTHDWAFWAACTPKIFQKLGQVFPAE